MEDAYRHKEGGVLGGGQVGGEVGKFEVDEEDLNNHWRYVNEEQPRRIQEYVSQQQKGEKGTSKEGGGGGGGGGGYVCVCLGGG